MVVSETIAGLSAARPAIFDARDAPLVKGD
jgi:hypothetical protein